jgi:putative CocE/NonD family hydrolase
VYTSAPLEEDLWIAGPLRLRLQVSSDAKDTDLVARLVHVWPDGRAIGIQEGALRLRYRNGFSAPQLLQPGQRAQATVDMRDIAYRLPKGHRLRLHLTSSSFPRLERNLNTGGDNATETRMVVATNRVHYDQTGSWLELRVLPRGSLP